MAAMMAGNHGYPLAQSYDKWQLGTPAFTQHQALKAMFARLGDPWTQSRM